MEKATVFAANHIKLTQPNATIDARAMMIITVLFDAAYVSTDRGNQNGTQSSTSLQSNQTETTLAI